MIKRMMLWAAMAAMTGVVAVEAVASDTPFPRRARLSAGPAKAMPPSLAKAVYADIGHSAQIKASDAASLDRFGHSVAIDGDTAVVGAFQADTLSPALLEDTGAAYVYVRSGNTWTQQQKLVEPASDWKVGGEAFGRSVAISGDTIAVGSPFSDKDAVTNDTGVVFVFVRSGGVWSLESALVGTETVASDKFGQSVSIDGNNLLVGSPNALAGAALHGGAAYVFTRSGVTWTQQGRLIASDPQEDAQIGESVGLSADTAVVGAPMFDTSFELTEINSGAAYVFARSAGVWSAPAKLRANPVSADGRFGQAVATEAGTVVVGEHFRNTSRGAVHVFTGSGVSWSLQQQLAASDAAPSDFFGHSLALLGNSLLIGAYGVEGETGFERGTAYRFERSGIVWSEIDKYFASDAENDDRFGFGVGLTAGAAIAGAPFDDFVVSGNLTDAGSAYLFHLGTPTTTVQILTPIPTVFGGSLGLNAQVSGGTPTGNVEFRNGASVLATAPLNGSGVAATSIVPNAGSYSVVAYYLGDGTHLSSNSTATAFTVAKAPTTLDLTSSGSPSSYGQNVTFTATVATTAPGASPVTGNVEFRDGAALLATVPLSGGVASHATNALLHNTGSAHPITATFIENTNYLGSTDDAINHVVNKAIPTLTLVSSPNPSLFGQSVTLTGTLSGGLAPTGTVTFFDGIALLGSNPVSAGVATRTTSSLALGVHPLQATYAGDDNHDAVNTAAPSNHTVLPSADVSVTKSNGTSFVQSGQSTSYSIVVSNPGGGADVDGLLVNDVLNPAYFDVGAATWSCAPAGICSPESGTGDIVNLPLDLPAGSTVTITLIVPVLLGAEDGVSNTVTLTLPGTVGDPDLANNSATDSDGSGLFKDSFED